MGGGAPFSFCCETMVLSLFCSSYAEKTEVGKEEGKQRVSRAAAFAVFGMVGWGQIHANPALFISFVHLGRE